ncbi:peptidoglycan editing factor PgeF [Vibrio sp. vnigr-6D03]|uniref:peptidoglycan editing factor PgeF n=1 Tax=Vibrio sp. vnigr-6D03 TaxID=2058088 RepID=UPI000C333789|nr:peptidoglycan editing factor PgeF [Vibrio sp. vnigr-6D03]PKF79365.1 peptidoglycan editing factor PgeF [Vibrio sp. vnigr-6D03]
MKWIYPNWDAPNNVKAISSTRLGGVSQGSYAGLNLGTHVDDESGLVAENRSRLMTASGMPSAPIWLNQTHSTHVVSMVSPSEEIISADGTFTTQPNIVCSAMTADCLPVLLTDTKGTQVAAVHAGWRGLAGGILEKALQNFSGDVMAWLGPAIGQAVFEVGEDVVEAFTSVNDRAICAFEQGQNSGKWLANMSMLATQRLNSEGVSLVYDSGLCTFSDPHLFYSYRRDGVTGRQSSFIWLE